jgi:transcriptional regulator with XRE-family HTH domain
MTSFKDFLNEQFVKDKNFEKRFYKGLEKSRIALEITSFRERAGLTQSQLAERAHTSQSAIARLESEDYHGYSIKTLRKIAEVLEVELVVSLRDKNKAVNKEKSKGKVLSLFGYKPKKRTSSQYNYEDIPGLVFKENVSG